MKEEIKKYKKKQMLFDAFIRIYGSDVERREFNTHEIIDKIVNEKFLFSQTFVYVTENFKLYNFKTKKRFDRMDPQFIDLVFELTNIQKKIDDRKLDLVVRYMI